MSITTVLPPPAESRRLVSSAGNGQSHWRTDYVGVRREEGESPEAFLIEMTPNETLLPHFHAVDQFQIFVEGDGTLGRDAVSPVLVHYADHHTGYGPIISSPSGLTYFTFRSSTDPGAVYLNKPGYREKLKPSLKRHATSKPVIPTIKPVLAARADIAVEALLQGLDATDGVGAILFRIGAHLRVATPTPQDTGGQYCLVLNGSIDLLGEKLPKWSIVFERPDADVIDLAAGDEGAEVLVLSFPRRLGRIST